LDILAIQLTYLAIGAAACLLLKVQAHEMNVPTSWQYKDWVTVIYMACAWPWMLLWVLWQRSKAK
jgi:hypothetical protein